MWWNHDGIGWVGWLLMMASMIAFWALVVWAVIAVTRSTRVERSSTPMPEEILRQRFARGEIDEQAYRRSLQVLNGAAESDQGVGLTDT